MANINNVNVYNPGPRFILSSPFGDRINPGTGLPKFHAGLDFKAPLGTPIPSATDGVVRYSGNNVTGGYGNLVGIESVAGDGNKILVFYAHMTGANMPAVGDQVKKGDVIGLVGNTGWASRGVHLHVSIVCESITVSRHDQGWALPPASYVDAILLPSAGAKLCCTRLPSASYCRESAPCISSSYIWFLNKASEDEEARAEIH